MAEEPVEPIEALELRCYFVRRRNCLLVRGTFTDLYLEYYLHLMQHGLEYPRRHDDMLKDAMAAIALHCGSRPHDETTAWTLHWQQPLMNLFVTGGGHPLCGVAGRVFVDEVRQMEHSLMIAQTLRRQQAPRQSMVEVHGDDVLGAVEQFYRQSEQRPTRLFRLPQEDFIQVSAEPDADLAWLESLETGQMATLDQREELSLLETRLVRWHCGCGLHRLYPMLLRMQDAELDEIFAGGFAPVQCPRCAARYQSQRDDFDRWRQSQSEA
jgi:molecular chaperone Hsp33